MMLLTAEDEGDDGGDGALEDDGNEGSAVTMTMLMQVAPDQARVHAGGCREPGAIAAHARHQGSGGG
jgi:hypothetical protein